MPLPPRPGKGDPDWFTEREAYDDAVAQIVNDAEAAVARAIPDGEGEAGQLAMVGPGGPVYTDLGVSADWFSDLNTAVTAAKSRELPLIGRGTYVVTDTVTIDCNADFDGATFTTTDTAIDPLLRIGKGDGTLVPWLRVVAPKVVQAGKVSGAGWGTDCGVELRNVFTSHIWLPHVKGFATAVRITAEGTSTVGSSQNAVHLGHLETNKVGLYLRATANGYVNDNNVYSGRFSIASAEGTNIAGARHMVLERNGGSAVNNNRFWGLNLEGAGPEYTVETRGARSNFWNYCRWEVIGGNAKVWFNDDAASNGSLYNKIIDGYDANIIVFTASANSVENGLVSRIGATWDATNANGIVRVRNRSGQDEPAVLVFNTADDPLTASAATYNVSIAARRFKMKATADTQPRIELVGSNGQINLSNGSAAADVTVSRVAANTLGLASGDVFRNGSGTTAQRPSASTVGAGAEYFDTTLGKPIWSTGSGWVDATGTAV